ncbi:unnamed protein product [Rotaria magnacalcarata]|uniref:Uncharacterized protein n=1 Tax=Rotaria magnacalcarata TaxID=392030 RepID=A0A816M5G0_9BILA|nr:unnamed protein product [Rotaria magnacalcarata]CAF1615360.1 unnamed protein product [Rotaria magnacalcarata]CAF1961329.1 unnamed protein product [Rotaria magnacalcarata]
MATSINKYLRKRYKGKFLTLNEDSLLCETCFAREQRRTPGNKNSIVSSSDDEYSQSISSGLLSDTPSNKRLCLSSISLTDPIEMPSSSGLSHSTPVVTDNQSMVDVMHNISSTYMSSPSDIETKCNFISKTAKEQLNGLLDVFSLSPFKDGRHTVVAQEKCQMLLKKTKILSDFLINSSSSSTTDTTNVNSVGYEDMEHLVAALQKLVLMSDHAERIRLLTLCLPTWSRRDISRFYSVLKWDSSMANELYESSGVLAAYENNQDRLKITPSTIEAVVPYYHGIRSYHHFQPIDSATIRCKITSDSLIHEDFSMMASRQSKLTYVKLVMAINDINMNDYVAVEYQGDWWLAMVQALETNLQELRVSFLHPPGPRASFKFPV